MKNSFYVFYNERNQVTGISPKKDEFLASKFKHTQISYEEVEPFITGKKKQSEAIVVPQEGSVTSFFITTKSVDLGFMHDINQGLTEIKQKTISDYDVQIKYFTSKQSLELNFSKKAKQFIKSLPGTNDVTSIPRFLTFYLTAKDDPSFVHNEFQVDLFEMLKHKISIELDIGDMNQYSLFTRRYFDNYSYKIIGKFK